MYTTEKEAREKECLQYQLVRPYLCKASRCMAWRWIYRKDNGQPTNKGYCGLAGKPE